MHRFCLLTLWKWKDNEFKNIETSSMLCNNNEVDMWENIMKLLTSKSSQVHKTSFYTNGQVKEIIIYNYDEM